MNIPGVSNEELTRLLWNYGGGHGALGYLHIPSGVSVRRDCAPGMPVTIIDAELLGELGEALRSQGIISTADEDRQELA